MDYYPLISVDCQGLEVPDYSREEMPRAHSPIALRIFIVRMLERAGAFLFRAAVLVNARR